MFVKSLKVFLKNPIITVPNIIFLLVYKFFLDWYINTSGISSPEFASNLTSTGDIQKSATLIAVFLLIVIAVFFVSTIITCWSNVLCKYAVDNKPIRLFEALKESFKYYWRMLGVLVLLAAIFIGVSVIFALSCLPLALTMETSISTKAVIIFILLTVLLIAALLFLVICFTPAQMLLVYDNLGIGEAISKGFKFGLKKFFKILGVILLIAAISLTIVFALQYAFVSSTNQIVNYISSLISTYLGMYLIVYIMNLYKNYKEPAAAVSDNAENSDITGGNNPIYNNDEINIQNDTPSDNEVHDDNDNPPENKTNFRL